MELKTQRLAIRPLRADDWPDMKGIFCDFNRSPYVRYDRPLPTEDGAVRALVARFVADGLFFTVRTRKEGNLAGYLCFHRDGDDYDLGYCFHSAFQGRGYARESGAALLRYMARTRTVARFTAGTALDNAPSCRLLEALGFVCVSSETVCFDGSFSFPGGNFERRP